MKRLILGVSNIIAGIAQVIYLLFQNGTIVMRQYIENGKYTDLSWRMVFDDEELAKKILLEKEIEILVELNDGACSAAAWGCDLTYDYVKINGDYRT